MRKQLNFKMSKSSEHTPLQGRDTNGKEAHEKMLHIWSQQANTNENHETPAYLSEWLTPGNLTTPGADEDRAQQELSLAAGGTAGWGSHLGSQNTSFLQN